MRICMKRKKIVGKACGIERTAAVLS